MIDFSALQRICDALSGTCVALHDKGRAPCTPENCKAMKAALSSPDWEAEYRKLCGFYTREGAKALVAKYWPDMELVDKAVVNSERRSTEDEDLRRDCVHTLPVEYCPACREYMKKIRETAMTTKSTNNPLKRCPGCGCMPGACICEPTLKKSAAREPRYDEVYYEGLDWLNSL